jgi:ceramide glucosyltransferase
LKPVRGLDAQAYQNFSSFCQQNYPNYEVLFGVEDPADPAVPLIERLVTEITGRDIRLIQAEANGANRKAGLLHQLAGQARHEVLVVSDSDMRVTPDYLRSVVVPLADGQNGLVTCSYRGGEAHTLSARLEALHMGVSFLPAVVVAREFLRMRFAMGATLALRRGDVEQIGGFAAVADYLADDYEMAVRIAELGKKIVLSDYVVVSVLGETTFNEQLSREVRWARCNLVNRPLEFPGLLLTYCTTLAVALVLTSGLAEYAWRWLGLALGLRWLTAWMIAGWTGDGESRRWLAWLPVRDLLSTLVWCLGLISSRVTWRGDAYVVYPGGKMEYVEPNRTAGDYHSRP